MSTSAAPQDPLEFVKSMWSSMGFSLPGIITPTLDPNELDKRIQDLKAVEGWLRMNLNMLSASINTLEIQRATLAAMQSFGQSAAGAAGAAAGAAPDANANPFINPSLWPWNFMQQPPAEAPTPPPPAADPGAPPK